ncbi:MAG: hypothetical protein Q9187_005410 [Circinaria calcarea]
MLLDAPLRDQGSALGFRILGDSFCFARPAFYDDIPPIQFTIQPSSFEEQFDGEEAAEDGSEDDEEDARPGVGASALGGPSPGVERSGGGGEEDHLHHRRRRRRDIGFFKKGHGGDHRQVQFTARNLTVYSGHEAIVKPGRLVGAKAEFEPVVVKALFFHQSLTVLSRNSLCAAMDMGSMGVSMGNGVPTLAYMQKMYWAAAGAVVAFATIVNVLSKAIFRQRMMAVARGEPEPAKPRRILSTAIATMTAITREMVDVGPDTTLLRKYRLPLPTAGRTGLMVAETVTVLVLCFYKLNPQDQWQWEDIGYRIGVIATAQLPFLYALAGKHNIIGVLTGYSYEKLNWLHRWTARILLLTVTIHMAFWFRSWARYNFIKVKITTDAITQRGFAAWCILLWIVFSSMAPIRRWNYEFFVIQHIVTFIGFTAAVYLHVPAEVKPWVWISIALFILDRVLRACALLYINISWLHPNQNRKGFWGLGATMDSLPGRATRITIRNPPIDWKAGQHVFLSCHSIVPLQSHPFTIYSLPQDGKMEFLIKSEAGCTRKIYESAEKHQTLPGPTEKRQVNCTIEGPYGRMRPLNQFDSVFLIAGSTGSTFILPLMRDLVRKWDDCTITATKHIRFIWAVKSHSQSAWFAPQFATAAETVARLRSEGRNIELHISIYVTCDETFDTADDPCGGGSIRPGNDLKTPITHIWDENEKVSVTGKLSQLDHKLEDEVSKACGPDGACCCTATIVDENGGNDDAAKFECRCGDDVIQIVEEEKSSPQDSSSIDTGYSISLHKDPMALHPSITVLSGRPHPRSLLRKTLEQALGESAVVACGPLGLLDDVRSSVVTLSDERAIHKGTGAQGIYLHTESYGY